MFFFLNDIYLNAQIIVKYAIAFPFFLQFNPQISVVPAYQSNTFLASCLFSWNAKDIFRNFHDDNVLMSYIRCKGPSSSKNKPLIKRL